MKIKHASLLLVIFIVSCMPGSATPGLGKTPAVPATNPAAPAQSPTGVEQEAAAQETTTQENDPAETSTFEPQAATTSYLPMLKTGTPTNPPPPPPGEALVADHRVVNIFEQMPASAFPAAIDTRVFMKHASTGQYMSNQGLDCLQGTANRQVEPCLSYPDYKYDRRQWDWELWGDTTRTAPDKVAEFVADVKARHNDFDFFGMKFCYQDAWMQDFARYRDAMLDLEAAYPDKKFIWWTQALRGEWTGDNAQDGQVIQEFNTSLRAYALANNKPLFDIAAIESHDSNGNPCAANGYESLCMEWVGQPDKPSNGHPSMPASIRLAKAYWWLMARMTGWNGSTR
jgi:hypothetical protein